MDEEEVKRLLRSERLYVVFRRRLPDDSGTQLRINNGGIVNLFDNGTIHVQGRNVEAVTDALGIPVVWRPRKPPFRRRHVRFDWS
jgi:predicted nucleotide-binding protein